MCSDDEKSSNDAAEAVRGAAMWRRTMEAPSTITVTMSTDQPPSLGLFRKMPLASVMIDALHHEGGVRQRAIRKVGRVRTQLLQQGFKQDLAHFLVVEKPWTTESGKK